MMETHNLWKDDLNNICRRVSKKKVKDVMYKPTKGEMINVNAAMGEAMHSFVIGHHQSLLVTKQSQIVGILRLTDMFKLLCERLKQ